jgi:hypothetical protein
MVGLSAFIIRCPFRGHLLCRAEILIYVRYLPMHKFRPHFHPFSMEAHHLSWHTRLNFRFQSKGKGELYLLGHNCARGVISSFIIICS